MNPLHVLAVLLILSFVGEVSGAVGIPAPVCDSAGNLHLSDAVGMMTGIPAGEQQPAQPVESSLSAVALPGSRSRPGYDSSDPASGFPFSPPVSYPAAHLGITSYNGSSTCIACHQQQALGMFGAVHYQWTGPTPNVPNINGNAGKGQGGINTYCGSVESSRHIACYSCHAGNGLNPNRTLSTAQLNNIDCMMCHQEKYQRTPAQPLVNLTFTDYTGTNRTWRLPREDTQGNFRYVINEARMPITAVQAAQTVHPPTRQTCLKCHAYAAGSNCGKRGDLSEEMGNPPRSADVHMSPQGANLSCQDCHTFTSHHVLGRGLDIRENDVAARLTCTSGGCHNTTPHTANRSFWLNRHTTAVSCQSCHISRYARLNSTEMRRDWTIPFWYQPLLMNQGGYKPEEYRKSNVTPTYAWFDGRSYVYNRGQVPILRSNGQYEFSRPWGNVNRTGSRIYPMKEHLSNSPMLRSTGQIIPWSAFTYFVTGNFNLSVFAGQKKFNMTGPWSLVNVHAFQTINHQVSPPVPGALQCRACHQAFSGGAPTRMNMTALGYSLKGPQSVVCSQCHGQETDPGFIPLHDEHRRQGVSCSSCHRFTR